MRRLSRATVLSMVASHSPGLAARIRHGLPQSADGVLPPEGVLPPGARWFFVAAPPALAYLFDPDCAHEPGAMTRALVAIWVYSAVTGLAVHHGFEWMHRRSMPMLVWLRAPAQLVFITLVVVGVSLPLLPLVEVVYPEVSGAERSVVSRAVLVAFAYLAIASFVGHLQRQAVRERTAALEARLAALRAQMQPHFLFNSLNVCAGLVHPRPDLAEETLDHLAGFLRYTLESTEQRFVSLDEELEAIRSYLEIQQQRFGERLRFRVESMAERWSVPPMVLQPLVENAVLHGVRESGGYVSVIASVVNARLELVVEDDGGGSSSHRGSGVGQKNVRERLELIYGDRARMSVGPRVPGGYRCVLSLPAAR